MYHLVQPALRALPEVPAELQIIDLQHLLQCYYPNVSTDRPALIGPLQESAQWAPLSALLRLAYPDDHPVQVIVDVAGQARALEMPLDAREIEVAGDTLLYVPPLPCPGAVETFQNTVAHLRAPDGCPWDRRQTHRSLRQGFQEETYEVLDALDRDDMKALEEELGDVLLHILLQAQIAAECGEFRLSDVVCHVHSKIVYRHPHVFGGLDVEGVEQVLINWEMLKQQEKQAQAQAQAPSALDGIAPAMPALARAQSIQRHVNSTGLVDAEVDELARRVQERLNHLPASEDRTRLLGDLLFDLTNLARKLDIDAESALRETNSRFELEFRASEQDS